MIIEQQDIIKTNFDNGVQMLCEMGTIINKVDILTEQDFDEHNLYLGKLYYNSEYFQYRILEEVEFKNITINGN